MSGQVSEDGTWTGEIHLLRPGYDGEVMAGCGNIGITPPRLTTRRDLVTCRACRRSVLFRNAPDEPVFTLRLESQR